MLKLLSAKVFEIRPKFAKATAKTRMLAVFFIFPRRGYATLGFILLHNDHVIELSVFFMQMQYRFTGKNSIYLIFQLVSSKWYSTSQIPNLQSTISNTYGTLLAPLKVGKVPQMKSHRWHGKESGNGAKETIDCPGLCRSDPWCGPGIQCSIFCFQ